MPQRLGRFEWATDLASIAWDGRAVYSGTYKLTGGSNVTYMVTADLGLVAIAGARFVLEVQAPDSSKARAVGVVGGAAAVASVDATAGQALSFTITVVD